MLGTILLIILILILIGALPTWPYSTWRPGGAPFLAASSGLTLSSTSLNSNNAVLPIISLARCGS